MIVLSQNPNQISFSFPALNSWSPMLLRPRKREKKKKCTVDAGIFLSKPSVNSLPLLWTASRQREAERVLFTGFTDYKLRAAGSHPPTSCLLALHDDAVSAEETFY